MEEAKRKAVDIMEEGKSLEGYTPSSTAEIQECIMLVLSGLVTEIEEIYLIDIDMSEMTSKQINILLSVVTHAVDLSGDIKLSASQTAAVFCSLPRLSDGICLRRGVEIDVAFATEALRGVKKRVRGKKIVCYDDKYRQEMGQWAAVLGWEYLDEGFRCKIK